MASTRMPILIAAAALVAVAAPGFPRPAGPTPPGAGPAPPPAPGPDPGGGDPGPAPIFHWDVQWCTLPQGACDDVPECGVHVLPHPLDEGPEQFAARYQQIADAGEPMGLFLTDYTAPLSGLINPLPIVLDVFETNGWTLDYALADIEQGYYEDLFPREANFLEMARLVRASTAGADALIGAYNAYPGYPAEFGSYPWTATNDGHCRRHTFYMASSGAGEFDTAMPSCYLSEDSATSHAPGGRWAQYGGPVSPNGLAAVLWSPLERASLTRRFLPPGDRFVPFVNGYDVRSNHDPDVVYPEPEDLPPLREALVRHLRLRGADGLFLWDLEGPDRELVLATWCEMDTWFEDHDPCILNLDTNKTGGVEWSGVVVGDRAVFQVSNLTGTTIMFEPPVDEIAETVEVPAFSHAYRQFQLLEPYDCVPLPVYAVEPCLEQATCQAADVNGDDVVDITDAIVVATMATAETTLCADPADPFDVDRDGIVDGSDVLQVILNLGACPGPGPMGACCLADAACAYWSAADCVAAGGTFFGAEDCAGVSCGACCRVGAGCVVTVESACLTIMEQPGFHAGVFHEGLSCAEACTGSCCLEGEACVELVTCVECHALGGTFNGHDQGCSPVLCGFTCRDRDVTGDGVVDFVDLLAILEAWGASGGPEDLDGSGEVGFGDLLQLLAGWGCQWGACCTGGTCVDFDDEACAGEPHYGRTCDEEPCAGL